jgi:nicotinic acid mononucleotide adenylyltransferase
VYPAKQRRNSSNKITICGGSYNPFHIGHNELLTKTLEYVDGSEVIAFITLKHSEDKKVIGASHAQRLYMLKLEQERLPFMSVGVINDGFFRNWFHKLNEFHPDEGNEYICTMGADIFPQVIAGNSIEDYPKVFSIDWVVAERSGRSWKDYEVSEHVKPYLPKVSSVKLSDDVKYTSSSGLREMLNKRDKAVLQFIAEDTFDYIVSNGIYY